MKKPSFLSIFSFFVACLVMLAPIYTHAASLKDMVGDYLVGGQLSKQQNNVVQPGVVDTQQIRFRGIELTPEWQQVYRMAQDATQKVDENLINAGQRFDFCANPKILKQLEENPKAFDYNFNRKIPRQASSPSQMFDFSTVMELSRYNRNFTGLDLVQIPNANAIGVAMKSSNANLIQNASAMALPRLLTDEVKKQYEMLGRNPLVDARDMYATTLRDIATIGYVIGKNPQLNVSFDDFFVTSMLIYTRNKVLCLYDAPIGYPTPF